MGPTLAGWHGMDNTIDIRRDLAKMSEAEARQDQIAELDRGHQEALEASRTAILDQ